MKERIKELRKSLKMTQKEFADALGLSKRAIECYEYGTNNVPERTIKDICRTFNVSYDWLVYGDGDMYGSNEEKALAIIDSVMAGEDQFARDVLASFASLTPAEWVQLRDIVKKLIENIDML